MLPFKLFAEETETLLLGFIVPEPLPLAKPKLLLFTEVEPLAILFKNNPEEPPREPVICPVNKPEPEPEGDGLRAWKPNLENRTWPRHRTR